MIYYTYYIGLTLLNCLVFAHSGVSGAGAWLNAHYDPVASLYTFSSCMGESNTHMLLSLTRLYAEVVGHSYVLTV